MKANELMIGDWVCYCKANNWYTKVEAINNPGQTYISDVYGIKCCRAKDDPLCEKAPIDFFNVEILHPIPLTAEILKKNGFTKHAYGFSFQHFKLYGNLRNDDTVYFTININRKDITIDYVHQLQHALRLCGIEKEIVL